MIAKGTAAEYRSLLRIRETQLAEASTRLTGNDYADWHTQNRIVDLEIKIADLKGWLAEPMGKRHGRYIQGQAYRQTQKGNRG